MTSLIFGRGAILALHVDLDRATSSGCVFCRSFRLLSPRITATYSLCYA